MHLLAQLTSLDAPIPIPFGGQLSLARTMPARRRRNNSARGTRFVSALRVITVPSGERPTTFAHLTGLLDAHLIPRARSISVSSSGMSATSCGPTAGRPASPSGGRRDGQAPDAGDHVLQPLARRHRDRHQQPRLAHPGEAGARALHELPAVAGQRPPSRSARATSARRASRPEKRSPAPRSGRGPRAAQSPSTSTARNSRVAGSRPEASRTSRRRSSARRPSTRSARSGNISTCPLSPTLPPPPRGPPAPPPARSAPGAGEHLLQSRRVALTRSGLAGPDPLLQVAFHSHALPPGRRAIGPMHPARRRHEKTNDCYAAREEDSPLPVHHRCSGSGMG